MAKLRADSDTATYFNSPHADWVARVLTMLIAVVGRESLLGQILRQTRSEIASVARGAEPTVAGRAVSCSNN